MPPILPLRSGEPCTHFFCKLLSAATGAREIDLPLILRPGGVIQFLRSRTAACLNDRLDQAGANGSNHVAFASVIDLVGKTQRVGGVMNCGGARHGAGCDRREDPCPRWFGRRSKAPNSCATRIAAKTFRGHGRHGAHAFQRNARQWTRQLSADTAAWRFDRASIQ